VAIEKKIRFAVESRTAEETRRVVEGARLAAELRAAQEARLAIEASEKKVAEEWLANSTVQKKVSAHKLKAKALEEERAGVEAEAMMVTKFSFQ